MLERDLQKKCTEYLKEEGIYYLNIHGSGWGPKGIPDLIICLLGDFVGIELKVNKNTMSPAQKIHERRIKKSKGKFFCVRDFDDFKKLIISIVEDKVKGEFDKLIEEELKEEEHVR